MRSTVRASTLAFASIFAVAACRNHDDAAPTPPKRDAAAVEVDWTRCEQTLARVPTLPDVARTQALLDGCPVCGNWQPLVDWNTPHEQGGPTRQQIEERMVACNAFCDSAAKQRFMGTLDGARGTTSRAPWRYLGEICKDKVSAVPDTRFMSAPYFALDRIARAASAHGGRAAALLANLDLPLPAVSLTGAGLALADAPGELEPAPVVHVTVLGDGLHVGKLPRAHLGSAGVHVDYGSEPYPGPRVEPAGLAAAIHALDPAPHPRVALFVPRDLTSRKLDELRAHAADVEIDLAVLAPTGLPGWQIAAVPAQKR
jgi:hypothetical protein